MRNHSDLFNQVALKNSGFNKKCVPSSRINTLWMVYGQCYDMDVLKTIGKSYLCSVMQFLMCHGRTPQIMMHTQTACSSDIKGNTSSHPPNTQTHTCAICRHCNSPHISAVTLLLSDWHQASGFLCWPGWPKPNNVIELGQSYWASWSSWLCQKASVPPFPPLSTPHFLLCVEKDFFFVCLLVHPSLCLVHPVTAHLLCSRECNNGGKWFL